MENDFLQSAYNDMLSLYPGIEAKGGLKGFSDKLKDENKRRLILADLQKANAQKWNMPQEEFDKSVEDALSNTDTESESQKSNTWLGRINGYVDDVIENPSLVQVGVGMLMNPINGYRMAYNFGKNQYKDYKRRKEEKTKREQLNEELAETNAQTDIETQNPSLGQEADEEQILQNALTLAHKRDDKRITEAQEQLDNARNNAFQSYLLSGSEISERYRKQYEDIQKAYDGAVQILQKKYQAEANKGGDIDDINNRFQADLQKLQNTTNAKYREVQLAMQQDDEFWNALSETDNEELQKAQTTFNTVLNDIAGDYLTEANKMFAQNSAREQTDELEQRTKTNTQFNADRYIELRRRNFDRFAPDLTREERIEYNKYNRILGLTREAKTFIDKSKEMQIAVKNDKGFFHSFVNTITQADTWDFGISELITNANLKQIADKVDASGLDSLTEEETLLLDAATNYAATSAYYSDELGALYKAGQTTAASLPFMLEFMITPLSSMEGAVVKAISKNAAKMLAKKYGKRMAVKKATGTLMKTAGTLVGTLANATFMTATYGMPKVISGAIERTNGDIDFHINEKGQVEYKGQINKQSKASAIRNSFLDQWIENWSEMAFNTLAPASQWLQATKLGKSLVGYKGKILPFIFGARKAKLVKGLADSAQFHGYLGEVLEEELGGLLRLSPLVSDVNTAKEAGLDWDSQIDTFLGLAPTSLVFGMLNVGGFAHNRGKENRAIARVRQSLKTDNEHRLWDALTKEWKNNTKLSDKAHDAISNILLTSENENDEISLTPQEKYDMALAVFSGYQQELSIQYQEEAKRLQDNVFSTNIRDVAKGLIYRHRSEKNNTAEEEIIECSLIGGKHVFVVGGNVVLKTITDEDTGIQIKTIDFDKSDKQLYVRTTREDGSLSRPLKIDTNKIIRVDSMSKDEYIKFANIWHGSRIAGLQEFQFNGLRYDTATGQVLGEVKEEEQPEQTEPLPTEDINKEQKQEEPLQQPVLSEEEQAAASEQKRIEEMNAELEKQLQEKGDAVIDKWTPAQQFIYTMFHSGIEAAVEDAQGMIEDAQGLKNRSRRRAVIEQWQALIDKYAPKKVSAAENNAEETVQDVVDENNAEVNNAEGAAESSAEEIENTNVATIDEAIKNAQEPMLEEAAEAFVQTMQEGAVPERVVDFTQENYEQDFPNSRVQTPIGEIKIGDNQYAKLQNKKRGAEFGMIKPTLEDPDIILLEYEFAHEGVERPAKLLFIKTFIRNGQKFVNLESVTILKEGLEISVSSHILQDDALLDKLQSDGIVYTKKLSDIGSERHLTNNSESLSDLVPTQSDNLSDSKDTTNSDKKQIKTEEKDETSQNTTNLNNQNITVAFSADGKAKVIRIVEIDGEEVWYEVGREVQEGKKSKDGHFIGSVNQRQYVIPKDYQKRIVYLENEKGEFVPYLFPTKKALDKFYNQGKSATLYPINFTGETVSASLDKLFYENEQGEKEPLLKKKDRDFYDSKKLKKAKENARTADDALDFVIYPETGTTFRDYLNLGWSKLLDSIQVKVQNARGNDAQVERDELKRSIQDAIEVWNAAAKNSDWDENFKLPTINDKKKLERVTTVDELRNQVAIAQAKEMLSSDTLNDVAKKRLDNAIKNLEYELEDGNTISVKSAYNTLRKLIDEHASNQNNNEQNIEQEEDNNTDDNDDTNNNSDDTTPDDHLAILEAEAKKKEELLILARDKGNEDVAEELVKQINDINRRILQYKEEQRQKKIKEQQDAERQLLEARAEAEAKALETKLGKINLAQTPDDVPDSGVRNAIVRGGIVSGWYNPETNEVWLNLQGILRRADMYGITVEQAVQETVFHEMVAHKGLRELLGEKKFSNLCKQVWKGMSVNDKNRMFRYAFNNLSSKKKQQLGVGDKTFYELTKAEQLEVMLNQEVQLIAADEYMAHLAQDYTNLQEQDNSTLAKQIRNAWQNFCHLIRELLEQLNLNISADDYTIAEYLQESYNNLHNTTNTNQQETTTENSDTLFMAEENGELDIDNYNAMIDNVIDNPNSDKSKYNRQKFMIANTPQWMINAGVRGLQFSLPYSVISQHLTKDSGHALTKDEWKEIPNAILNPFLVTRYKGSADKYRLYTTIMHNGHFVAVGIDIKKVNRGKDKPMIEINSIKTAFAKESSSIATDEEIVCYDKKITPEQSALLRGHNFHEYPTIQELISDHKDTTNSLNNQIEDDFSYEADVRFSIENDLTPEEQQIREQAKADGTYMQAPNGQPTRLTEKQWLQVRTQAFKQWFGDWENDPENASRVLDENGEPLVLYHGRKHFGRTVFNTDVMKSAKAIFFADNAGVAKGYAGLMAEVKKTTDQKKDITANDILDLLLSEHVPLRIAIRTLGQIGEWDVEYDGDTANILSRQTGDALAINIQDDKSILREFAEKNIDKDRLLQEVMNEVEEGGIYATYVNAHNFLEIDANENAWDEIPTNSIEGYPHDEEYTDANKIATWAKQQGYDGVFIRNTWDSEGRDFGVFSDRTFDEFISLVDKSNIKSATENNGNFNPEDSDIRFSIEPSDPNPATISNEVAEAMERRKQQIEAQNDNVGTRPAERISGTARLIYDLLDNTHGLLLLQKKINLWRKQQGKAPIPDSMDVRSLLNRQSSAIASRFEFFNQKERKRLDEVSNKFIERIERSGLMKQFTEDGLTEFNAKGKPFNHKVTARDLLERYLIARDNIEWATMGNKTRGETEFVKRMGMTMVDYVKLFESTFNAKDISELWDSIRACTNKSIDALLEGERISQELYDEMKKRHFYVPEKDFAEDETNESLASQTDSQATSRGGRNAASAVQHSREGGDSMATNILENIVHDVQNSISRAQQNLTRKAMWELMMDNLDYVEQYDIPRPRQVWYVRTGKNTYGTPIYERVTEQPSQELFDEDNKIKDLIQEQQKLLDAETDNNEKARIRQRIKDLRADLNIVSARTAKETGFMLADKRHQVPTVEVYINGVKYEMTFNGMPEVADALNGKYNLEGTMDGVKKANAVIASLFTTYNPTFFAVNLARDIPYIIAKGGSEYGGLFPIRFTANLARTSGVYKPIYQYLAGDLDTSTKEGKMFYDFLMGGGNTGYSQIEDIRKIRERFNHSGLGSTRFGQMIEIGAKLNEFSELLTRFAAYKACLESGYSNNEALNAAKNLSTNFNRRGAGNKFLNIFGSLSMFSNAAIQGASGFFRTFSNGKNAARALFGMCFMPAFLGFLNTLLCPDSGGDEYEIADFYRDNYACIGSWKIPIAPEFIPFWRIGVNIAMQMQGRRDAKQATISIISGITEHLLPLPPAINDTLTKALQSINDKGGNRMKVAEVVSSLMFPQFLAGLHEVANNKDFSGNTITKYDFDAIPQYQLAEQEAELYKDIAKFFYWVSGGNMQMPSKYKEGSLEEIGVNVNPKEVHKTMGLLFPAGWLNVACSLYGIRVAVSTGDTSHVRKKDFPLYGTFYRPEDKNIYRYKRYKQMKDEVKKVDGLIKDAEKQMKGAIAMGDIVKANAIKSNIVETLTNLKRQGMHYAKWKKLIEAYNKTSSFSIATKLRVSEKELKEKYPEIENLDEYQKNITQQIEEELIFYYQNK